MRTLGKCDWTSCARSAVCNPGSDAVRAWQGPQAHTPAGQRQGLLVVSGGVGRVPPLCPSALGGAGGGPSESIPFARLHRPGLGGMGAREGEAWCGGSGIILARKLASDSGVWQHRVRGTGTQARLGHADFRWARLEDDARNGVGERSNAGRQTSGKRFADAAEHLGEGRTLARRQARSWVRHARSWVLQVRLRTRRLCLQT